MNWPLIDFEAAVNSRGSGNKGLPQSEWLPEGNYPVIGQGADYIEGWSNRGDLVLRPTPAVVLYGGHTRRAKFVDQPFVPGPNVKILEPSAHLDAKFLFRYLDQLKIESRGYADHFPEVRRCKVPVPPLAEQKRIATLLDAADALRQKRRDAIATLVTLVQSVFHDMFGDPIKNPKGWPRKTVGDALSDGSLVAIQDGNHGERHPKVSDFCDDGVPFIMANCMRDGSLDLSRAYRLPREWLGKLRVGFACAGDALLSHKGTIGEVAVVPDDCGAVILSPQVTYYRPSSKLLSRYLTAMFSTPGYQDLLAIEAKQSTRAYIGITRQRSLPLVVPAVEDQRRFLTITAAVEGQKVAQRKHLAELDSLFAALQQRAFTGQL
jgi:type I restriction enzyme, S subunit